MSEKRKKIYRALVDGAAEGLSDKALHDYVVERCKKASSKRIIRAALLALTDPDVTDRNILNTIYALAIQRRMDELGKYPSKTVRKALAVPSAAPISSS